MDYIQLNSGERMPILGTGTNTYGKEGNQYGGQLNGDFDALKSALALGYRSVDAAVSYGNEQGVGETLAKSDVPREEFFITSKLPRDEVYYATKEAVRNTIDSSLANFETDYLDLYLIHHPITDPELLKSTWEVFEEYYKDGKLKSIGVSNFSKELLESMKDFASVKPAVNQIQINLKEKNEELVDLLQKMDIAPVAWGPMKATAEQKNSLTLIGEKYNKNWAQVLLRYQIQRGIIVIPKSHNADNQAANIDIFDFKLTDDEMAAISTL